MKKFRFAAAIGTGILVSLTACSGQSPQVQESSQTESQEVAENTAAASQAEKDPIEIATKPMTEQYILGEMLKELVEQDTDLKVVLTQGVGGGTSNIEPAIEKGDFDLYPEYTGTGWNMVLKNESLYDESMFDSLKESYEKNVRLTWCGMYGFNNTYGLAVRKEIADKYHLKTYSDLAKVSNFLTFGAEYDFYEREDGYDALCDAYDFRFQKKIFSFNF